MDDEIRPKALMIPFDKFVILDILDPVQYKNVITQMRRYVELGEEPEGLEAIEQMAFESLRPFMDENINTYQRSVLAHRKAGRQGGRPKRTDENQEKPNGFSENQMGTNSPLKYKGQSSKYKVQSSSSKDDSGQTMTTTSLEDDFGESIGKLTDKSRKELSAYADRMGEELVRAVIAKCADLGAHSWAYVRKALDEAEAQGCTSADEYRMTNPIGGSRAKGTHVSREVPAANDWLKDAARRRPMKKKGEQSA